MTSTKWFICFTLVPIIACGLTLRQAYLSKYGELSTWKGGGMGMFASADSSQTRFVRSFIETRDGKRTSIGRMLPSQEALLREVLWYPRRESFIPLARSIRNTSFIASPERYPVMRFAQDGFTRIGQVGSYNIAYAQRSRPIGDKVDWSVVFEYWKISYDPSSRRASSRLIETMSFGKEVD